LVRWLKKKHKIQATTPKDTQWGTAKGIGIRSWMNNNGWGNHGSVPFQVWRTDGTGHGKPLGIVRKGKKQKNLKKMIKAL